MAASGWACGKKDKSKGTWVGRMLTVISRTARGGRGMTHWQGQLHCVRSLTVRLSYVITLTGEGEDGDRQAAGSCPEKCWKCRCRCYGLVWYGWEILWMMALVLGTSRLLGVECWEITPYPETRMLIAATCARNEQHVQLQETGCGCGSSCPACRQEGAGC